MALIRWMIVPLCVLTLLGCGGKDAEPVLVDVEGTVTMENGSKLASGEIVFEDRNSGKPPTTLQIRGGEYRGKVPVGQHRIGIYSYKEFTVPAGQPGEGSASKINVLHAKHGQQSSEVREVTESGPNRFDFKVSLAK